MEKFGFTVDNVIAKKQGVVGRVTVKSIVTKHKTSAEWGFYENPNMVRLGNN